jgi:hypothetical protein
MHDHVLLLDESTARYAIPVRDWILPIGVIQSRIYRLLTGLSLMPC